MNHSNILNNSIIYQTIFKIRGIQNIEIQGKIEKKKKIISLCILINLFE